MANSPQLEVRRAWNAEFIHMALPQGDRLKRLNQIAIRQMQTLSATAAVQQLGQPKESKP